MSREAMSPLRGRIIEDMTICQFGEPTKRDYIRQVHEFTAFPGTVAGPRLRHDPIGARAAAPHAGIGAGVRSNRRD